VQERKQKQTSSLEATGNQTGSFLVGLGQQLFSLYIVTLVGGAVLWSARVAQTNILPTSLDSQAFTIMRKSVLQLDGKEVPDVLVNIGILTVPDPNNAGKKVKVSTKLLFDVAENASVIRNGFLGTGEILNWTNGEDTSSFWLFLGTVWQKMSANYLGMTSAFYGFLNRTFSESIIIFLVPFLMLGVVPVLTFVNLIYGFVLWVVESPLLFSRKNGTFSCPNPDGGPKPKKWMTWRKTNSTLKSVFACLLTLALFLVGLFVVIYLHLRCLLTGLLLPLCIVAKKQTNNEPYNVGNLLFFDMLRDNLGNIMKIVSLILIVDSAAYGSSGLLISIAVCILIYTLHPDVYKPLTDASKTPVTTSLRPKLVTIDIDCGAIDTTSADPSATENITRAMERIETDERVPLLGEQPSAPPAQAGGSTDTRPTAIERVAQETSLQKGGKMGPGETEQLVDSGAGDPTAAVQDFFSLAYDIKEGKKTVESLPPSQQALIKAYLEQTQVKGGRGKSRPKR
jgi:hypothetical protein